jgi:multicomponent Na+:H+ antiporter subunit D
MTLVQATPLAVAAPLLMAALMMPLAHVMPRRLADALATACAAFVAILCGSLAAATRSAPFDYWFGGWNGAQHGMALGIAFHVDAIGAGIAALAASLVTLAFIYSWSYFDTAGTLFHVLMLVFLAAMAGFSLTGDIFNLFVFFELMSVAAFALTGYKIEEKQSIAGAINFAITNSIGAFLVLIGIALLYGRTGVLNMAQIASALAGHPADGLVAVSCGLIVTGFFVKGAVVPFHLWLDDAHAVAPTPLCVLFSGVMVQLSLYAVARIYWTIFAAPFHEHDGLLRALLVSAGVVTALVGGIMAFGQRHLKRLLAFSTISHSGLFVCGLAALSTLGIAADALFILAHGLVKAALFMGAGNVLQRRGTVDERQIGGAFREMKWTTGIFVVGGLALAGMPPFGLAAGKSLLDASVSAAGYAWLPIVFGIASALDAGAVLRVAAHLFVGTPQPQRDGDHEHAPRTEQREAKDGSDRTTPWMIAAPYAALLLTLGCGVTMPFIRAVQHGAAQFMHDTAFRPYAVWSLETALSNGAVTLAAVLLAILAVLVDRRRAQHEHERFRVTRLWEAPMGALRAWHSGVFTDYVLWLMIGVACYGAIFVRMASPHP